jgi:CBS domain-containing protein
MVNIIAMARPVRILSPEDRVDKVLKALKTKSQTFVVANQGKYMGILTDRVIHIMQHDPESKVASFIWHAPVLRPGMELDQITEAFLEGYRELAVCDDGKIIGVLKHVDLLNFMLKEGRVPPRRVSEVMSSPIISVTPTTGIAQAAALMRKEGMHHLAVVEGSNLVGMISIADILPLLERTKDKLPFARERMGMDSIQLKSVAVSEVLTIREGAFITEAASEMVKRDASTLVVYEGRPLGIISVIDILRASLPSVEPPLEIVGLPAEDVDLRDDIHGEMIRLLKRVEKYMPITHARLLIKKYKKKGENSKWSLKFMITGKKTINVDASDWVIFKALHFIKEEVEKIAMQEKDRTKGKRSRLGKKRSLSARKQTGEFLGRPV